MNWMKTAEKRPKHGQSILGAMADGTYGLLTYDESNDIFINENTYKDHVPGYIDYWIVRPVYPTMENREFRFEK